MSKPIGRVSGFAILTSISILIAAVSGLTVEAATTSWTNYHFDLAHTGNDTGEPAMSGVALSWTSATLDGRIYGEPIVFGGIVYVVTQRNTVYGFDPGNGTIRLHPPLALTPLPLGSPTTPHSRP